MDWLFPAVLATFLGTGLLVCIYYYLYHKERDRTLFIFSLAWLLYSANTFFMMLFTLGHTESWIVIANQLLTVSTAIMFLVGTSYGLGRRIPPWVWYATIAISFLVVVEILAHVTFVMVALPSALLLGSVYIWNGWMLLRTEPSPSAGKWIAGIAFILWGIHELDYPFLRPIEWIAPYGYIAAGILAVVVAFGLILSYFERARAELFESRQRLRQVLEGSQDIFVLFDTDLRIRYFSGPPQYGLKEADVLDKRLSDFFPPESAAVQERQMREVLDTGRPMTVENCVEWQGETLWLRDQFSLAHNAHGETTGIVRFSQNITDRKLDEVKAERKKALLNEAEIAGRLGSFWLNIDNATMQISDGMRRLLAIQPGHGDLTLEKFLGRLHPADRDVTRHHINSLHQHKNRWNWDVRAATAGGKFLTLNLMLQPALSHGDANEVLGIVVDVTDQRATEQTREKHAAIVTGSSEAMISCTLEMIVTSWNPGAERIFGYRADEIIGESLFKVVPEDRRHELELIPRAVESERGFANFETVRCRKDGTLVDVSISASPIRNSRGEIREMAAVIRDVSEANRMARRLRERQAFLDTVIQSSRDCIIITGAGNTLKITEVNEAALRSFGYEREEMIGQPVALIHIAERYEQFRSLVHESVQERGSWFGEWSFQRSDGKEILMATTISPLGGDRTGELGSVAIMRDISERRKAEEELARADKLESIGLLAGGIAHDFNNILTGVIGNLSLASLDAPPASELAQLIEDAQISATRAQDLTQQLLTFSKGGAPIRKTSAIADIIAETTRFALHGTSVRCDFDIAPDLSPADIDSGQISQVIGNLIINASQAMPSGGTVEVSAHNCEIKPGDSLPLSPGKYVMVSVRDTGIGIPPDRLDHIFEPFFTSKPTGNGLGLATSYAIIRNHDGYLGVKSAVNVGTTFTFYLPASDREIEETPSEDTAVRHGSGRLLVVDDEQVIRKVASRTLERLGYAVDTAASGEEALQMFLRAKEEDVPYDVVLLDLTIPGGMGGVETLKRLKSIDPKVKAIVCSGFSSNPIMAQYAEYGFAGIVAKPFHLREISEAVAKVLRVGRPKPRTAGQPANPTS